MKAVRSPIPMIQTLYPSFFVSRIIAAILTTRGLGFVI